MCVTAYVLETLGEVAMNVVSGDKRSPADNLPVLQINKLLTVGGLAYFDTRIAYYSWHIIILQFCRHFALKT